MNYACCEVDEFSAPEGHGQWMSIVQTGVPIGQAAQAPAYKAVAKFSVCRPSSAVSSRARWQKISEAGDMPCWARHDRRGVFTDMPVISAPPQSL